MPVVPVDAITDARLSRYRVVSDRTLARQAGLFVAEGRLVVERLLCGGRYRIESLLLTPASFSSLAGSLTALDPEVPIFITELARFRALTGFHLHRGCVALAHRPDEIPVETLLSSARTILVLDDVADPDNVGGIFRNAAAFGVDAIVTSPATCDPFYRKAIRTSMAATLAVPFSRSSRWPEDLVRIRQRGYVVVALAPRAQISIYELTTALPRDQQVALVLGTEGRGVSEDVRREADFVVGIPTTPAVDSLNVAVACGIALSWWRNPR